MKTKILLKRNECPNLANNILKAYYVIFQNRLAVYRLLSICNAPESIVLEFLESFSSDPKTFDPVLIPRKFYFILNIFCNFSELMK